MIIKVVKILHLSLGRITKSWDKVFSHLSVECIRICTYVRDPIAVINTSYKSGFCIFNASLYACEKSNRCEK